MKTHTKPEIDYNRKLGTYKKMINAQLRAGSLKQLEMQLQHIIESQTKILPFGIAKSDAIDIMQFCIRQYKKGLNTKNQPNQTRVDQ